MKTFRYYTIVLSSAILAVSFAGCKKAQTQSAAAKVEPVQVMQLKKEAINRTVEFTSTLTANQEVNVVPATPGKIDNILVNVGTQVNKGQLLVQMDPTQLNTTQIQLANLQTDINRLEALRQTGTVSQQTYDQTKVQYDLTKTNLENLEKNVNLRAPFSGIISAKNYEAGDMYSGSPNPQTGKAAIVTLLETNPLKAMVNIPESYLPQVKAGMKVNLTCDVFPNQQFSAQVARVYPTIDPATRSVQLELRVPNNNDKLLQGMFCRAVINFGNVMALVVPYQSVIKKAGSDERYVFLEKNGKAQQVIVTLGQRFDDRTEIVSDKIAEGDNLIVTGQNRLIDGVQVKIVQ